MGCTPVDQAKGIETVKDAIRRLQFSQQMKKAESGSNIKTKKVEITISVDGVAIQVSFQHFHCISIKVATNKNNTTTVINK